MIKRLFHAQTYCHRRPAPPCRTNHRMEPRLINVFPAAAASNKMNVRECGVNSCRAHNAWQYQATPAPGDHCPGGSHPCPGGAIPAPGDSHLASGGPPLPEEPPQPRGAAPTPEDRPCPGGTAPPTLEVNAPLHFPIFRVFPQLVKCLVLPFPAASLMTRIIRFLKISCLI